MDNGKNILYYVSVIINTLNEIDNNTLTKQFFQSDEQTKEEYVHEMSTYINTKKTYLQSFRLIFNNMLSIESTLSIIDTITTTLIVIENMDTIFGICGLTTFTKDGKNYHLGEEIIKLKKEVKYLLRQKELDNSVFIDCNNKYE